jgi:hypothetical protein
VSFITDSTHISRLPRRLRLPESQLLLEKAKSRLNPTLPC